MEKNSITSLIHSYSKSSTMTNSRTLTVSQIPSHTHNMWDQTAEKAARGSDYGLVANNSLTFPTSSSGGGGSHTHGITLSTDNTTSIGSGTAINSLPSYYAVYIWTRTA